MKIDNEQIIALVEKRPVIWDKTLDNYNDRNQTLDAWREICTVLTPDFENLNEKERSECGKAVVRKWTHLRDNWMKSFKKIKQQKLAKYEGKIKKPYVYDSQMSFLKKVTRHKIKSEQDIIAMDEHCTHAPEERSVIKSTSSQKAIKTSTAIETSRKITENQHILNRHMLFFHGILPSLNTMDDAETIDFQMDVLKAIKDIKKRRNPI